MSGPVAHIDAVGLLAPGLPSWEAGIRVLRGEAAYVGGAMGAVHCALLPANERRRAPLAVRMALRASEDLMAQASVATTDLASVFATSDADMEIVHKICSALREPARGISPTDFHNSVHNSAAGYWGIAAAARRASTTLAAYDFCCTAGVREALAMLAIDDTDVLLMLYDVVPPQPLYATRPIEQSAALAMALTRKPTARSLGRLSLCTALEESRLSERGLESLRCANPAMRALPLLQLLAMRRSGVVGVLENENSILGLRFEAS